MSSLDEVAVSTQRDYYARTADHYDAMHLRPDDEHGVALAAFIGLAKLRGVSSILDVGAGTGRGIQHRRSELSDARLVGVEPVQELREVGHQRGIPPEQLVAGDALALTFSDNEFDFVIETGVLHHVPDARRAVQEIVRVASKGVMISDSNKYGQGSPAARRIKGAIRAMGLWDAMIRLQTKGKMSKWSEGDELYYSYSVFDSIPHIRVKFPRVFVMNTAPADGSDPRSGASHAMLVAFK